MSDQATLLRAILDDPEDDAVRLVYADILEEQGDVERAGFIRSQCQLARYAHSEDVPFESGLEAGRLVPKLRQAFLAPLLALGLREAACRFHDGDPQGFLFTFRRGFVEDIECYGSAAANRFIKQADRLFALTPIRHVRFLPNHVHIGLDDFDVAYDPISPQTVVELLRLPHVARLRGLDLRNHRLGDRGAFALLGSPHLGPKTTLWFAGNLISPEAAQALRERFGLSIGVDFDTRLPPPVGGEDDIPF